MISVLYSSAHARDSGMAQDHPWHSCRTLIIRDSEEIKSQATVESSVGDWRLYIMLVDVTAKEWRRRPHHAMHFKSLQTHKLPIFI